MSKKRKNTSPSGKKKGGISTLLIKVFERKPGEELTHKQVCELVDARDPATRQMVFDSLNRLVESSVLKRTNHFTFSLGKNNSLFEGIIQLTQRGSGFVVCEGEEKDIFIAPQNIGPNPATDYIQITMNGVESANLKIMDALGTTISKEAITSKKKINVSDLRNGVYFVVIEIPGSKTITRKVIIRH